MKKTLFFFSIIFLFNSNVEAKLRTWSLYESENFSVYTDLTEKGALHLIEELETFRLTVLSVFTLPNTPENIKLKVFVYSRPAEYNSVRPDDGVIGFFMPTDDGPRMIVGPSKGFGRKKVLYHEYVHHLLQEHLQFPIPRWYNEGFAEFLTTTELKKNSASIGLPNRERIQNLGALGLLPLEQLFAPNFDYESGIFTARYYATSWIFMHYLQISPDSRELGLTKKIGEFIARINHKENTREAFETSFGLTLEEMDQRLKGYMGRGKYSYNKVAITSYGKPIEAKKLSANQRASELADIASKRGLDELALELLSELDASKQDAARGLSLMAILENHRDAIDKASLARDQAFKLNSENSLVLSNIAHHDWDSYTRTIENGAPDETYLQQTLTHAAKALEKDPLNLEAYFFQWQAQASIGEPVAALKSMMASYQIQPTNIGMNATIGTYLYELNRPDLARPFLEKLYNWSHNPEQVKQAKDLLDKIDQVED